MAITVSKMTGGSNSHETTSEEANGLATDFVSEGIIGSYSNTGGVAPATGAFAVNAQGTPDMTVAVSSGVAYVTGTPTSQNSQTFRVYNSASENVTISANSSGSTKYDWVYIKLDATLLANPTLAGTTTATLVTSRSTSAGTDDGTPPTYGYPVAVVTVANGAVSITNSTIRDIRATASIGTAAGIATGWNETGLPAVSSVTNNGNRSYSVVFASTVASLLSPGMRLRTTRTVTAPTQCTSLTAGSSHYYSRASGSMTGMTFTGSHTTMGWVKLIAYSGTPQIIGRNDNATGGFSLSINSTGQVRAFYGAASAFTDFISYQSLPLNKWVHVAASVNAAAKTCVMLIDGVVVPTSSALTAATTVVQTSNFEIGRVGVSYGSIKIAQAAVFSTNIATATIQSYMSQGLSGSETNLVSAYSFNNSINDLSANANNLTANNGVVATNADSPFGQDSNGVTAGTTDYELVMKVNGATATVQVPEGCTIPTSGGVSAVAYSTATSPFGFTLDKGRWEVMSISRLLAQQSSPVLGTWYNINSFNMSFPVGQWATTLNANIYAQRASGNCQQSLTLSTSTSAETDRRFTASTFSAATTTDINHHVHLNGYINVSSATLYYALTKTDQSGMTNIYVAGDRANATISAIPAGV